MSTNSNCLFIEVKPGEWYLVLEDYNAPKNAWDWREYAEGYGPFQTDQVAIDFLDKHFANPGGWSTCAFNPEKPRNLEKDAVLKKLIEEAPKNKAALQRNRWVTP